MKYLCKLCGYIEETDNLSLDFICPLCGAKWNDFERVEDNTDDLEIDSVIDLVIEEAFNDETPSKIIINDEIDKKILISEHNNCITRVNEKCINCGQCKKTCENIANISYNLNKCEEPICIGCGQCILNCPTGAIIPKYSYREVKDIIDRNEKIVVALISPAVRVSIGEAFGLTSGENYEKKLVTALKKLGFDYVFDTAFGADLTILEEVAEFANRLKNKDLLPQFTSCCPSWVKYAEIYHPEILNHISTCKSPIGMQCAIIKSYFAENKGFDSSKIVTVAITPCTAKKMEAKEYTLNIDYVLTASETALLLKEENVDFSSLDESDFDVIMGESSGGGIIFGASGGVCESVIRTLYRIITKNNILLEDLTFKDLRGFNGIKEAKIKIGQYILRVAVVQQLENIEKLLENDLYKKYHFIEVMNCRGGCSGGGGQPLSSIPKMDEIRSQRINGLYNIDKNRVVRSAHDNNELKILYKEYLKQPLSDKSLSLLHTSYSDKSNLLNNKN